MVGLAALRAKTLESFSQEPQFTGLAESGAFSLSLLCDSVGRACQRSGADAALRAAAAAAAATAAAVERKNTKAPLAGGRKWKLAPTVRSLCSPALYIRRPLFTLPSCRQSSAPLWLGPKGAHCAFFCCRLAARLTSTRSVLPVASLFSFKFARASSLSNERSFSLPVK